MAAPQYATIANLQELIDNRLLQQLTSDDGTDQAVDSTNLKLVRALERASSDVQSHASRGRRYTDADLEALETAGDVTLLGLVADLALYHLAGRRGGELSPAVEGRMRYALDSLKALSKGELVFGKSTVSADAGLPKVAVISHAQREDLGLVGDSEFFPVPKEQVT